mmetsp:Transcript_141559/g.440062  ORF Transcript_141559/g.440062 Transcript_141559/m.440062 type:complete len:413 (+) Transcript_141559:6-1244(+)
MHASRPRACSPRPASRRSALRQRAPLTLLRQVKRWVCWHLGLLLAHQGALALLRRLRRLRRVAHPRRPLPVLGLHADFLEPDLVQNHGAGGGEQRVQPEGQAADQVEEGALLDDADTPRVELVVAGRLRLGGRQEVRLDHVGEAVGVHLHSPPDGGGHGLDGLGGDERLRALALVLEAWAEEKGTREEHRGAYGGAGERDGGGPPEQHRPPADGQPGALLDDADGVPMAGDDQGDAAPDPQPRGHGVAPHERPLGGVQPRKVEHAAAEEQEVADQVEHQLQHLVADLPPVLAPRHLVLHHVEDGHPRAEDAPDDPQEDAGDVDALRHELEEEDARDAEDGLVCHAQAVHEDLPVVVALEGAHVCHGLHVLHRPDLHLLPRHGAAVGSATSREGQNPDERCTKKENSGRRGVR